MAFELHPMELMFDDYQQLAHHLRMPPDRCFSSAIDTALGVVECDIPSRISEIVATTNAMQSLLDHAPIGMPLALSYKLETDKEKAIS